MELSLLCYAQNLIDTILKLDSTLECTAPGDIEHCLAEQICDIITRFERALDLNSTGYNILLRELQFVQLVASIHSKDRCCPGRDMYEAVLSLTTEDWRKSPYIVNAGIKCSVIRLTQEDIDKLNS